MRSPGARAPLNESLASEKADARDFHLAAGCLYISNAQPSFRKNKVCNLFKLLVFPSLPVVQ